MLLLAFAPALACANIGHHFEPLDRESQRGKLLGSPKKDFIAVSRRTLKPRTRPALLFARRNLNLCLDRATSGSTDPWIT